MFSRVCQIKLSRFPHFGTVEKSAKMIYCKLVKLSLAIIVAFTSLALCASTLSGKVVRIADGDTCTVLDSSNTQHKIRLDKIDAPESKQAYGNKAKEHLAGMIAGKEVSVEWKKKDQYGRVLGEIFVGELNVNLQMVKDGYAWHYKHFDKTESYAQAESEARAKKLGLWQDANPVNPYEFRKSKRK